MGTSELECQFHSFQGLKVLPTSPPACPTLSFLSQSHFIVQTAAGYPDVTAISQANKERQRILRSLYSLPFQNISQKPCALHCHLIGENLPAQPRLAAWKTNL